MYGVSDRFKSTVRGSHQITVRAEVWSGDVKVLDLEPVDGQVEIDGRRAVRRTCSLTVAAPEPQTVVESLPGSYTYESLAAIYALYSSVPGATTYASIATFGVLVTSTVDAGIVPATAADAITPFGNEVKLWRGVRFDDGTVEEVPLGVFVITTVDVVQNENGTVVSITGSDRALRIQRARWTDPYPILATELATAVNGLLVDRWQDVSTAFPTTTFAVTAAAFGVDQNGDPWKDAQSLAEAAGFELFFDGSGVARLEEVPDYDVATPDETYSDGQEAVVLDISRSISADQTYNGVIAVGEGTNVAGVFRGEEWDEDPTSPTYRFGTFGQVPRFYSSPLLTSADAAQAAAKGLLAKSRGAVEQIGWSQLCDPSLDAGDVVALTNAATKVANVLVLDRLTIPLAADQPMQAVARAIRTMVA